MASKRALMLRCLPVRCPPCPRRSSCCRKYHAWECRLEWQMPGHGRLRAAGAGLQQRRIRNSSQTETLRPVQSASVQSQYALLIAPALAEFVDRPTTATIPHGPDRLKHRLDVASFPLGTMAIRLHPVCQLVLVRIQNAGYRGPLMIARLIPSPPAPAIWIRCFWINQGAVPPLAGSSHPAEPAVVICLMFPRRSLLHPCLKNKQNM